MFDLLTDPNTYLSLMTLTALEIVLGIDNILFLSIVASRLPKHQQETARRLGLSLALIGRLSLLFSLSWLLSLHEPLLVLAGYVFSAHDLVLGLGGLFLIYKATQEIYLSLEGREEAREVKVLSLRSALVQIFLLDIVFSLDSIITAVGLANQIAIMSIAILIAVVIMLFGSRYVNDFLEKHPSMKILGLAFLLLVGVLLFADALGTHFPRAYVYSALGFSAFVEFLNIQHRKNNRAA
ncbi:MAG: TerC family protein [Myxococcaceae bacterium]|nr:TerC family protein [Myxococcaceae bacterium]MBH2006292.1 TerC family protein [Myxococcaceae bacterium]